MNGPNLNLLGVREPGIYGDSSFEAYLPKLKERFPNVELEYYQSNIEGEMINKLQEVGFTYDGIVLNAGAYTHTSIAILDALKAVNIPTVEVHVTDPDIREDFRKVNFVRPACIYTIKGQGFPGYLEALDHLKEYLS